MTQGKLTKAYAPASQEMDVLEITIGALMRQQAATFGQAEALTEILPDSKVGRRWTYAQLLRDAENLARALASRYAKGERIVVWSPNCPEWVLLKYAAALSGLILVTANPTFQEAELRYVIEQSGAVGLFISADNRGTPMVKTAQSAVRGNRSVREVVLLNDQDTLCTIDADLPDVAPTDAAQIQYTSGTTGFPKGAKLSHRGLINNARYTGARAGLNQGSVHINILPLFHTGGCGAVTLGSLQAGCRMVLIPHFDPKLIGRVIAREQVTNMVAVPTMVLALLEAHRDEPFDTRTLRHVVAGGAMVAPAMVRAVKEQFGATFAVIYGQTEYCPMTNMHRLDEDPAVVAATVGPAIPQTEISVRSLDDNSICAVGEIGEICARGPCTMIGYHNNPEATATAIDNDGWLHTGDLGRMNEDGYLVVTGRLKEMIIRGGENLYPVEIENVLNDHPSVAEVAVIGLPDERLGEIVAAFVRLKPGKILDPASLKSFCREHMSPQKTPSVWQTVDGFPMTASGKIQKFKLRELACNVVSVP